jgi:hypothetical protein
VLDDVFVPKTQNFTCIGSLFFSFSQSRSVKQDSEPDIDGNNHEDEENKIPSASEDDSCFESQKNVDSDHNERQSAQSDSSESRAEAFRREKAKLKAQTVAFTQAR